MWVETICVMSLIAISKANYYDVEDYPYVNATLPPRPTLTPGYRKDNNDRITTTEHSAAVTDINEQTTTTPVKIATEPGTTTNDRITTTEHSISVTVIATTATANALETMTATANAMETTAATANEMETTTETANEMETTTPTANAMETTTATTNEIETTTATAIEIETTTATANEIETTTTTYTPTTQKTNLRQETTFIETSDAIKTTYKRRDRTELESDISTTDNDTSAESILDILHKYNEAAFDIPALMDLIKNLTGEFETNLTNKLNESLHRMTLPTCATPTLEPPTTSDYDANYTGSMVAKCFVCGLEVEGIPPDAHCADAFAGDFMPLVPVDPTAKAQASRYRRYCRYENSPGWAVNSTQPRSIFGRWTGGCAVRWIDLSGIYTQRVCRSRLQPVSGRHYISKRMAKLEKALWNVDNGCIVSPMATLVPLSRAISLYARFHVCVCTGSWCNRAVESKKVSAFIGLVLIILSILVC